jgi:hypothetical protein
MKAYTMVRPDIATNAALITALAANPEAYLPGTFVVTADGVLSFIQATATTDAETGSITWGTRAATVVTTT